MYVSIEACAGETQKLTLSPAPIFCEFVAQLYNKRINRKFTTNPQRISNKFKAHILGEQVVAQLS